jgi:hypothetical protein
MSLTICMERFYGELGFRGATRLHHNGFFFSSSHPGERTCRTCTAILKTSDRGVGTSSGSFVNDVFDLWLFFHHLSGSPFLRFHTTVWIVGLRFRSGRLGIHIYIFGLFSLLSLHFMIITYISFLFFPCPFPFLSDRPFLTERYQDLCISILFPPSCTPFLLCAAMDRCHRQVSPVAMFPPFDLVRPNFESNAMNESEEFTGGGCDTHRHWRSECLQKFQFYRCTLSALFLSATSTFQT